MEQGVVPNLTIKVFTEVATEVAAEIAAKIAIEVIAEVLVKLTSGTEFELNYNSGDL